MRVRCTYSDLRRGNVRAVKFVDGSLPPPNARSTLSRGPGEIPYRTVTGSFVTFNRLSASYRTPTVYIPRPVIDPPIPGPEFPIRIPYAFRRMAVITGHVRSPVPPPPGFLTFFVFPRKSVVYGSHRRLEYPDRSIHGAKIGEQQSSVSLWLGILEAPSRRVVPQSRYGLH